MLKTTRRVPQTLPDKFPWDLILAGSFIGLGILGLCISRSDHSWDPKAPDRRPATSSSDENKQSKEFNPPFIPHILSPTSGSHFESNQNDLEKIVLTWSGLPEPLHGEIEVRRMNDPEFRAKIRYLFAGAEVELPDGQYQWRVRSQTPTGNHSAWSDFREFILDERIDLASTPPVESPTAFKLPEDSDDPKEDFENDHEPKKSNLVQPKVASPAAPKRKASKKIFRRALASHSPPSKKYTDVVDAAEKRIQEYLKSKTLK